MKNIHLITAMAAILLLSYVIPPSASAQVVRRGATTLIFQNASNQDVAVLLSVPNCNSTEAQCALGDGCPSGTIRELRYVDLGTGRRRARRMQRLTMFGAPDKGWFMLKRGHSAQVLNVGRNPYTRRVSSCLQGLIFGFGAVGASCPDSIQSAPSFPDTRRGRNFNNATTPRIPNGTNGFECTLNPSATRGGKSVLFGKNTVVNPPTALASLSATQEGLDITCVNGANCQLKVDLIPPRRGPYWNTTLARAQGGFKVFRRTANLGPNSWVDIANQRDDNCVDPKTGYGRLGVFPYGCTQCNRFPDLDPPCIQQGREKAQFCAAVTGLTANTGCVFARSPTRPGRQRFGGTVLVTYMGPIAPPMR